MGATADVDTQVDAPQQRAVQSVAVQQRRSGIAVVRIVVGIGGVPLQQYLVLAVAIHITHTGIVGGIAKRAPIGGNAIGRFLQLHGQIAIGSIGRQLATAILAATTHLVGGTTGQRRLIYKKSAALAHGFGIEFHTVAIHIKGFAHGIAGECAPADHHLTATADGHHATVQLFAVDMLHVVTRLGLHKRWGNEM